MAFSLLYKWRFDDGSGMTASEDILSNDGVLITDANPPDWVAGLNGGALQFDGSDFDWHASQRVWVDGGLLCTPAPATGGFAMAVVFKTDVAQTRSIFCRDGYDPDIDDDPTFLGGFYQGSTNKLYFGHLFSSPSRDPKAAYSDATVHDGAWHVGIGTYNSATLTLWVDRVKQTATAYSGNNPNIDPSHFLIGMGRMNPGGTSIFFPATSASLGLGTFNGVICECRVYCGSGTDSEVEAIYDDIIRARPANAMMFSCNT